MTTLPIMIPIVFANKIIVYKIFFIISFVSSNTLICPLLTMRDNDLQFTYS